MSSTEKTSPMSQMEVRSECRSATTSASRQSCKSSASLVAAQARAAAEAARTKAEFARRQIDIEVEKARIEARLNALKQEGEAEAALAAARVLEAAAEGFDDRELTTPAIPATTPEPVKRTEEYIKTHFDNNPEWREEKPQRKPQSMMKRTDRITACHNQLLSIHRGGLQGHLPDGNLTKPHLSLTQTPEQTTHIHEADH
ncbi:hypothetical protein N1851_017385 [Merluccius polli]|uniref:Uncharacterized protein n=1 Tax=Merluccius polli TaxID=89951 RepID=A0AA47P1A8_MERPO|nr:hypothetical protein N1851_017385 [Merluccius polli]